MSVDSEKKLLGIETVAARWDMSKWSVRRLITDGELKSVTIGARRLVPLTEVERAEQFGVGRSRERRRAGATTQ
jgi:excisionase family DNA binding protein